MNLRKAFLWLPAAFLVLTINGKAFAGETILKAGLGNYFINDQSYKSDYGSLLLPSLSVQLSSYVSRYAGSFIEYSPKLYNGTAHDDYSGDGSSKIRIHFINFGPRIRFYQSGEYEASCLAGLSFSIIRDEIKWKNGDSTLTTGKGWFGGCFGLSLEKEFYPGFSFSIEPKYYLGALRDYGGLDVMLGVSFNFNTQRTGIQEPEDGEDEEDDDGASEAKE